jgi:hypothetical protein
MSQDPQQALPLLCGVVAGSQGRVEQTLIPRDHAFDLPAMSVDSFREPAFHQTTVPGLRPMATVLAGVQPDRRGADAQGLSAQHMVGFAVVAGVRQQPGQRQMTDRLPQGRGELGVVAAGTSHHPGGRDQVGPRMADDGQLGPGAIATTGVSAAVSEVGADVVRLQAGGVDRPFRFVFDQAALSRPLEEDAQEAVESPFFSSRCSA